MRVAISDFQSIQKAVFAIEGLTVVKGGSSEGKSSCFKAIYAAVNNRFTPRQIRFDQEKAVVKVQWESGEDILTVIRRPQGSPTMLLGDPKDKANIQSWAKLSRNLPKEVEEFNNLGKVSVGQEQYDLSFHKQFEEPLLIKFSNKRIMEILSASKALDDLQKVHYRLSALRERNRGAFDSIDAMLSGTKAELSRVKFEIEELRPLYDKVKKQHDIHTGLEATLAQLQELADTFEEYRDKKQKGLALGKIIEERTKLETIKSQKSKLTELVSLFEEHKEVKSKGETLTKAVDLLTTINPSMIRCQKLEELDQLLLDEAHNDHDIRRNELQIEQVTKMVTVSKTVDTLKIQEQKYTNLELLLTQHATTKERITDITTILDNNLCPLCRHSLKEHDNGEC